MNAVSNLSSRAQRVLPHRMIRAATVSLLAAITVLLAFPGTSSAAPLPPVTSATAGAIYDNIPSPLPGNLVSESFEATATSEFGGAVTFAGTARANPVVTVIMSSWGCQSGTWNGDNCVTTPGATFSEPITLNIYNPGTGTTEGSLPGSLLASVTQTFQIPYRPSASAQCTGAYLGTWYDAASSTCFNGLTTPISFNLAGKTLPSGAIISVAFNTSDYGSHPYGDSTACHATSGGCGYDSLNVGLNGTPTVGGDPLPNGIYQFSTWSGGFCVANPASPPLGVFSLDTGVGCWTGYQPAIEVQAATPTVLTASPSVAQVLPGLSINLSFSAELTTSAGNPVSGEPVSFKAGGQVVCTATTSATGTASCGAGNLSALLASVLGLGYTASFAGDGVLQPSTGIGAVAVVLGTPIL